MKTGSSAIDSAKISYCMMANDVDIDETSSTHAPSDPAFNLRVTLVDDTGANVSNNDGQDSKTVNYIGLSCPQGLPTIPIGGVVVSNVAKDGTEAFHFVSRDDPTWLPTDVTGTCNLKVYGDFTLPPLLVSWKQVTGNGQEIPGSTASEINLSIDNVEYLRNVTPDKIGQAQGFDGSPMLQAQYKDDPDNHTAIANAIRGMAGANSDSQQMMRPVDRNGRIAVSSESPWKPSQEFPKGFSVSLNDEGKIQFTQDVDNITEDSQMLGSFGGDLKHFIHHVINGVEKITNVQFVYKEIDEVWECTIHGIGKIWKWTLDHVAKAFNAIVGFLKHVVSDIRKVIEWLSYVFNWEEIIENAKHISAYLAGNLDSFSKWLDDNGSLLNQTFKDNFQEEDVLHSRFDRVSKDQAMTGKIGDSYPNRSGIDGSTPFVRQNGNPAPGTNPYGNDFSNQCHWLHNKIGMEALLPSPSVQSGLVLDSNMKDPKADFVKEFTTLSDACISLKDDFENSAKPLARDLRKLFHDASTLRGSTLHDFLAIVEDLISLLAKTVKDLLDVVLQAFIDTAGALCTLAKSKIFSDGNFISKFFKVVAGMDLTPINLISIILAVPVTLIESVDNLKKDSLTTASHLNTSAEEYVKVASIASDAFAVPFDMGADLGQELWTPLELLVAINGLASFGLNMPEIEEPGTATALDIAAWTFSFPPVVYDFFKTFVPVDIQEDAPFKSVYGGFMIVVDAVMAGVETDSHGKPLTVTHNILSRLPNLGKCLIYADDGFPTAGTALVCTVDAVAGGAAFVTGVVDELT